MARKVVLIGCGNMGYAMLKGWLDSGVLAPGAVCVVEPSEALRKRAAAAGASAVADAKEVTAGPAPDLAVVAIKPQVIRDVMPAYRPFAEKGATFLSIAAGTGIATFEEILGREAAVMRCMPNTPAAIGKGMMVVFSKPNVRTEIRDFVNALLATSGAVATVDDEKLMDAVTAVSGSGPAYVFHFIECLAAAGEKAGRPAETAKLLALQTVFGAACLAKESGEEPARLREQVTSPGGTTAAALSVLMGGNRLCALLAEAVEAARKRGIELGK